jgi:hypothetical protein
MCEHLRRWRHRIKKAVQTAVALRVEAILSEVLDPSSAFSPALEHGLKPQPTVDDTPSMALSAGHVPRAEVLTQLPKLQTKVRHVASEHALKPAVLTLPATHETTRRVFVLHDHFIDHGTVLHNECIENRRREDFGKIGEQWSKSITIPVLS